MHRCRQITPDHILILRQALGVDCCPTPCANYYVAGAQEFDLLEEMIRMGANYVDRITLGSHNYARTEDWDPKGLISTLPSIATMLFS